MVNRNRVAAVREPADWPEHRFYAMGSHMSARVAVDEATAAAPLMQVEALFAAAEQRLSRFDAASELSAINARTGQWVSVSKLLWDVLADALDLVVQTDGLFDPTLLSALEDAGYDRSFEQLSASTAQTAIGSADDERNALEWVGGPGRHIRRRQATREIWLPPTAKLDLGGIAKGFVAQQAVSHLRRWGPALVDAGGDLVAGDAPPGFPGWPVAVAAPDGLTTGEDVDLATLWLVNAALATSGIDYRTWTWHGRTMHHIIDPSSGQPAETDLVSATVLAPSATQAEAWAKAALILGTVRGSAALESRKLAALLVDRQGHVHVSEAVKPWLATDVVGKLN